MAVDRSAVSKNAQSLASRGQFDAAIAEWQKLLTKTPADAPIFNTIGDLLIKKKSPVEAIGAYCKAAEIFRADKELLKAIAAYKKILKVDPDCAEIYRYLGDLNAERGLVSSAVTDYSTLAKLYLKEGKTSEALEAYRTVLRHDPSNVQVQKRIDELSPPKQASPDPSLSMPAAMMPADSSADSQQAEKQAPALSEGAEGAAKPEPTLNLQPPAEPATVEKTPAPAKPEPTLNLQPPAEPATVEKTTAPAKSEPTLKLQGATKPEAAEKTPAAAPPSAGAKPQDMPKLQGAAKPGAAEKTLASTKAGAGTKPGTVAKPSAVAKPGGTVTPSGGASVQESLLSEALQQINNGEFDSADTILAQLLNQDPGNPQVCQLLARLHLKRGEVSMALHEYEFLAGAAMRADDFNLAESLIQEYLAVQSACAPLLEMLGRVYEKRGNPETAALHYKQAILVLLEHPDPDLPTLPAELYDTIKELVPASPLVSELASLLEAKSTVADSPGMAESAVVPQTVEPGEPVQEQAQEEAPPVLRFGQTPDAAIPPQPLEVPSEPAPSILTDRTVSASQDQPEVHFTLGQAYKDMGLLAEAIDEFRYSLTTSHLFLDSSLELAACLRDQGMIRRAIASLEHAMNDPSCQGEKSVEIRYELGLLLEAEGLSERAVGVFEAIPTFKDVAERLDKIRNGGPEGVAPSPESAASVGAAESP